MKNSHRLLGIACAALLTLGMLASIDRLARTDPPAQVLAAGANARA